MISFIHCGGPKMASYRYRTEIPARELGASINDFSANVLIFSKPQETEVEAAISLKKNGRKIVVDFCDDHMDWPHYRAMLDLADVITCPTENMATRLRWDAHVIPDPYEFNEVAPHCNGDHLLWFGHATNKASLARLCVMLPDEANLRVVSNMPGTIPWSIETMEREFFAADIVIVPKTEDYKSPNRTVESIRQGCFVVAEQHPSLKDFPGIWIGDIKEGIEWATKNQQEARNRTLEAQHYIRNKFSPQTQANAWKTVLAGLI